MLQTPSTFNPNINQNVPFTSQMSIPGYPNAGQNSMGMAQSQNSFPQSQDPMSQVMGDPQTMSYAKGGKTSKKRVSMVEAYMSPDEIAEMVEAQGGPEYDRHTGRHIFKKLSRFIENPHVERSIRAKFAQGGRTMGMPPMNGIMSTINQAHNLGMPRPGFAKGGSAQYSMPQRSPMSDEKYARGGDTELVYITPHMKRLFDEIGAGSINPVTGHPEYFGMSDIWNGIKEYGGKGLNLLNEYAPQISEAAKPFAAKLPGFWGELATAGLDLAPKGINALNNYVNPSSAPKPADVSGLQEMPFANEDMSQPAPTARQNAAQFAGNVANQFNNPAMNAMGAGAESYLRGRSPQQSAANMFHAGTNQINNPAAKIANQGAAMYGARAPIRDTMKHMGNQVYNQMMGKPIQKPMMMNNSNDQRRIQSQYLDQIYGPQERPNNYQDVSGLQEMPFAG